MHRRFFLLTPLLAAFGCRNERFNPQTRFDSSVGAYRFLHKETTGITSYLVIDGRAHAVVLHPQSNPRAKQLLHALSSEVFLSNSAAGRMIVVGRLASATVTPSFQQVSNAPSIEAHQEFLLERWYLLVPFLDAPLETPATDDNAARLHTKQRRHLAPNDFSVATTEQERESMVSVLRSERRGLQDAKPRTRTTPPPPPAA